MNNDSEICDEVLIALRRVIRAIDLHSRSLITSHGLTGPQALILKVVSKAQKLSAGEIARKITLSQATVTDILNRLEKKGLVTKLRDEGDRRRIWISATDQGLDLLEKSPPLLQERFIERFTSLQDWEQTQLLSSLQRIAALMNAEDLDAAPLLSSGAITTTAERVTAHVDGPVQADGVENSQVK